VASSISKYGTIWPVGTDPLEIEMAAIKKGGRWTSTKGIPCGEGLFHHYKEMMSILWPKDDHHRWSDLILKTYFDNEITVITGCSDSSKTFSISKIILCDYWCFPNETLWLVSTTEGRGSELRIWGVIKDLFNSARERFGYLQGNPLDYLKTITTDSVDEEGESARSLRRGIIVIPCKAGGVASGLAPYQGIKAPRLRYAGDEIAAMGDGHLHGFSNWFGKEDFKSIMAGNFMECDDPLGVVSEPENGWDSWVDSGKTQTWKSRFYGAQVIALDGRDSPNFDFPQDALGRQKYRYLIGPKKLKGIRETKGEDSWEWWSQVVGKPVKGMDIWRVWSKDFCKLHKASEEVFWRGTQQIHGYGLDPAYGGGDLCVGRHFEMGLDIDGKQILFFHPPEIVPIKINTGIDPEDQIAEFVAKRLVELNIPSTNCFYDSFGRGTLGFSFSKRMVVCPVPIDSSAKPTQRPVRFDLFVQSVGSQKRLKRCDEHYKKFITELWFSVREAVDAEQVRGLDQETIREGCSRKFTKKDDKIEVEPKDDMKERAGKSPDKMDNAAICCEGARRLGFKIQRNIPTNASDEDDTNWLDDLNEKTQKLEKAHQLVY
jgi:hypothetical protein